jgi:putative phosphoesterase
LKVGVISDTHIPGRAKFLPPKAIEHFQDVDRILHAGDLVESSVIEELSALAPVIAVRGNMDLGNDVSRLPEEVVLDLDGVILGMVHDSGSKDRRRDNLRKRFPEARIAVFGHSHQPLVEDEDGLLLLNPGSACDPRSAKYPTIAMLEINAGHIRPELIRL